MIEPTALWRLCLCYAHLLEPTALWRLCLCSATLIEQISCSEIPGNCIKVYALSSFFLSCMLVFLYKVFFVQSLRIALSCVLVFLYKVFFLYSFFVCFFVVFSDVFFCTKIFSATVPCVALATVSYVSSATGSHAYQNLKCNE